MSVDSENKSNEAIVQFIPSADHENANNGNIEETPVTPEMVLRLPTITDSKFFNFDVKLRNTGLANYSGFPVTWFVKEKYKNIM